MELYKLRSTLCKTEGLLSSPISPFHPLAQPVPMDLALLEYPTNENRQGDIHMRFTI